MNIPLIVAIICFLFWLIAFGLFAVGGIVHGLLVVAILGLILGVMSHQNKKIKDLDD